MQGINTKRYYILLAVTVMFLFVTLFSVRRPVQSNKDFLEICVVAGNAGVMRELEILIKSILVQSRDQRIRFHFLAGNGTEDLIPQFMNKITKISRFQFEVKTMNQTYIKHELDRAKIAAVHHSGLFGYSKAFIFRIWNNVNQCLLADTDVVFGTDPAILWQQWNEVNVNKVIMMRLAEKGFLCNTGVMLMNFAAMRNINFEGLYQEAVQHCTKLNGEIKTLYDCGNGDQGMYFRIYTKHPKLFHQLQTSWNLNRCQNFYGFNFETNLDDKGMFFGAAHFNCFVKSHNDAFTSFLNKASDRSFLKDYVKRLYYMKVETPN